LNNENEFLEGRIPVQCNVWQVIEGGLPPLFAGNIFRNLPYGGSGAPYSVYNFFYNINREASAIASTFNPAYFYKNTISNCGHHGATIFEIIYGNSHENPVNLNYIRKNSFIYQGNTTPESVEFWDDAYAEISENYFEHCDFQTEMHASGKIYNNVFNNTQVSTDTLFEFNNNLVYNGGSHYNKNRTNSNNIIILDDSEFGYKSGRMIENSVIFTTGGEMIAGTYHGDQPDTLRNCLIDFDINDYPGMIDGGNNILVSPEQVDDVFIDFTNDDFHLVTGSSAIDAGFDAPGYEYTPFDLDGRVRQWSGIPGNDAIIDIGVFEYGSPALGEINVFTINSDYESMVNYVLLIFNDNASDFEFTDNYGYVSVKRPAGIYEIHAQRMLYEDAWACEIEAVSGESRDLFIPMTPVYNLSGEDNTITNIKSIHSIKNYPNPFNPSTTISFVLTDAQKVQLSIYNIKGQKIKTLIDEYYQSGTHSVLWDGNDDDGNFLASGLYVYCLKTDNEVNSGKFMLLK
jgi:hypothetical protein